MNTTNNDLVKQDAASRDVHNETRAFDPLTDDWKQRPDAYAKWAVESFNALHIERNGLAKQNVAYRTDNLRLCGQLRDATTLLREIVDLMPDWSMKDLKEKAQDLFARCEAANLNTSDSPTAKP